MTWPFLTRLSAQPTGIPLLGADPGGVEHTLTKSCGQSLGVASQAPNLGTARAESAGGGGREAFGDRWDVGLGRAQEWTAGEDDAFSQRSHGRGAAENMSCTVARRASSRVKAAGLRGCVPCDSPYVTF